MGSQRVGHGRATEINWTESQESLLGTVESELVFDSNRLCSIIFQLFYSRKNVLLELQFSHWHDGNDNIYFIWLLLTWQRISSVSHPLQITLRSPKYKHQSGIWLTRNVWRETLVKDKEKWDNKKRLQTLIMSNTYAGGARGKAIE